MGFINCPLPTAGGKVFWDTIENKNGWKLQENILTGHYRILDPDNIRQAWDTQYSVITNEFRKFAGGN